MSVRSTWRRIGLTNSSISTTIAFASLASLMMSASSAWALDRLRYLSPQKPGHHLDAGERVLQLVRDPGRHLPERREAIPQPLPLLQLLDLRQVLEEHRRANRSAPIVLDLRQRVPDDAIDILQPQLGAVWQRAELEGAREHPDDVRPRPQHLAEGAAPRREAPAAAEKILYASSLISASVPSRRMVITPLRMLLTI
jgi:hypothetical protein